MTNLPATGVPVYVRLWTQLPTGWFSTDYTYTAINYGQAAITSPAPGAPCPAPRRPSPGARARARSSYSLWVGTTPGGNNLYSAGDGDGTLRRGDQPAGNGRAHLRPALDAAPTGWFSTDYTYTAVNYGQATITSPTPGSTLTGTSATFTWSAGTGALSYSLWVGTTAGGNNLYSRRWGRHSPPR